MKAGTHNHLKMKRLKRLLQVPLYRAVGILEMLWLLCVDCCDEGNIGKFTDEEIADYLEWDGDACELVRALANSGWLDANTEQRYVVHDWLEHCPSFIKDRVRMRRAREVKEQKNTLPDHQQRTYVSSSPNNLEPSRTDHEPDAACHVSSYSIPSQSIPTQPIPVVCPETNAEPSSAGPPPQPQVVEPAVMEFPCDGNPNAWRLTTSQLDQWQTLFPSLDIRAECQNALAWVLALPARRKTARGMPKFLVNWFGKSQNRGGQRAALSRPTLPGQCSVVPKLGGSPHDSP